MQEFKSLNGFTIKDDVARKSIIDLQGALYDTEIELHGRYKHVANPNLLINSDFRNPINQRGKTSYTTTTNFLYTVDRWRIADHVTLEVIDGAVKLSVEAPDNKGYMIQVLEKPLPVDDYTVTVKAKNVTGNMFIRCQGPDYVYLGNDFPGLNGEFSFTVNGAVERVGVYLTNGSAEIEYIKLERGRTPTPLTPYIYGDELERCKRFYQKSNGYEYFGNVMSMGSNVFRILSNYQDFRTAPTVKVASNTELLLYNRTDGEHLATNPVISEVVATDKGMLKITAPFASGASIPVGVIAITQLSKELEFDAEIYS